VGSTRQSRFPFCSPLSRMPAKSKRAKQLSRAREVRATSASSAAPLSAAVEEGEESHELSVGSDDLDEPELVEAAPPLWDWHTASSKVYADVERPRVPAGSVFSTPTRGNSIRTQQRRRQAREHLRDSAGQRGTMERFLKSARASCGTPGTGSSSAEAAAALVVEEEDDESDVELNDEEETDEQRLSTRLFWIACLRLRSSSWRV